MKQIIGQISVFFLVTLKDIILTHFCVLHFEKRLYSINEYTESEKRWSFKKKNQSKARRKKKLYIFFLYYDYNYQE